MTVPFSGAGVYLTTGGYLVELNDQGRATVESSPGTYLNQPADKKHKYGWSWRDNGTIQLDTPWNKLLILSEKLRLDSIPKPPEGFEYENEYPQYRKIKKGEIGLTEWGSIFEEDSEETSLMYIPLKETTKWYNITDPNYVINYGDQYYTDLEEKWVDFDASVGRKLSLSNPYTRPGFKVRSKIEPIKYYEITDPNYRINAGDFFLANSVKGESWLLCGSLLAGRTLGSLKAKGIEKVKSIHPHIPIIDGAGVYETKGGYLVELDHTLTSRTPVPGIVAFGAVYISKHEKLVWQTDGSINGMNPEWTEKLRIVEKFKGWKAIPKPPVGYDYKDGYPQYCHIQPYQFFLHILTSDLHKSHDQVTLTKHIPLVLVEQHKIEPKYYECDHPDPSYVIREGDQYLERGEWCSCVASVGTTAGNSFRPILKMRSLSPFPESKSKKAEEPKLAKEAKLTTVPLQSSLFKRSLNWWIVEPVSNAFRYAVITAVLWGGVEIYKNPAIVWKFLPKVSVSINK